ncbi:MAG: hypothetical protein ACF788_07795 [Novipirellula sp. JB048]
MMMLSRFCTFCLLMMLVAATTGLAVAEATEVAGDENAGGTSATVDVFGEGKLEVPSQFKATQPQSNILEYEFVAKSSEDENATARVTFMPAGGDVRANIARWRGQFQGGDAEAQKTKEMKLGKWNVHLVDLSGKFKERVGGGPFFGGKVVEHENYAMAGAIIVHPEGRKYFVKMVGPAEVVSENRDAFVQMIKSIER